jgi:hypothetical protein
MDARKRRHTLHPSPPSCKQLLTNLCNPRNPGVGPPTNLPRSLSALPSFHGRYVLAERFVGPEGPCSAVRTSEVTGGKHCEATGFNFLRRYARHDLSKNAELFAVVHPIVVLRSFGIQNRVPI